MSPEGQALQEKREKKANGGDPKERGRQAGAGLILLLLLLLFAFPVFADTVNLELSYGYQNTAKAGRFLPLTVQIENTMESTFSGYIHVYMAESGSRLCDYRYQTTVEGRSSSELTVTLSLGTGVSQLLVTAESRDGQLLGSKRIGLDVAGSDAELIIGVLSERPEALSYLNDVGIHDGLLRTRLVELDRKALPAEEEQLDQLDILLISDYAMKGIGDRAAESLRRWIQGGGILLIGTGKRGTEALSPYFDELLKSPLDPMEMSVNMGEDFGNGMPGSSSVLLTASPVYLRSGREQFFSDVIPMISTVSEGAGIVAVSGYDFCELQSFATERPAYVDRLLSAVLGRNRLDRLSVSASEKSLKEYWSIDRLMNLSDISKLPNLPAYTVVLLAYTLLIGPGLYFFMREYGAIRQYRPVIMIVSLLSGLLVWVLGTETRLSGSFLTYASFRDVSEHSIEETDFINLRSPYNTPYGMDIKTEYFVYPLLKGSDYTGDLTGLPGKEGIAYTGIEYGRERSSIRIRNEEPFTARYFELNNKLPNAGGSFQGSISYFDGKLGGSIQNGSAYTLYDAAVLLYGRMIRIGRLEAGQELSLSGLETEAVPVGEYGWISERVSTGLGGGLLSYWLAYRMDGYFSNARLVGFTREERPAFTEDSKLESYGITMITASLPLTTGAGEEYAYNALSRDPELKTGDYLLSGNTISGMLPTVLAYHLGEEERILGLSFESLSVSSPQLSEKYGIAPFQGNLSIYNYETKSFESIVLTEGRLEGEALLPYLNEENILELRYTPHHESTDPMLRYYLPMIMVKAVEKEAAE